MNRIGTALIVDDEPDILELLSMTLGRMGLKNRTARGINEARRLLAEQPFDLCLTDMRLPDGDGIDLVRHVARNHERTPIAVITAYGNVELAVEALKAGAFDFISKPVKLDQLRKLIGDTLKIAERTREPAANRPASPLLGDSPPMAELRRMIDKVARSQSPVHIHGETGTGKELVARQIHLRSVRSDRPFVPVNCGAIPTELMESEFFGHRKGSFTGAHADKEGLFQAANGGTLFLDEIAELPASMQVKLLRAIQERSIRPVGSSNEVAIDTRILSATHKHLGNLVEQGTFRHDLYYRIHVIELKVPSLRDKRDDIPELANTLLERLCRRQGETNVPVIDDSARRRLLEYSYPGNVRELENILERAMTLCEGGTISADDIDLPLKSAVERTAVDASSVSNLDDHLEDIERQIIADALRQTRGNKTAAAELLGISFRSFRYKVKKLGIER